MNTGNTPQSRPESGRRDDKDSDMDRGPPNAVLTGRTNRHSIPDEDTDMHDSQDLWEFVRPETPTFIHAEQARMQPRPEPVSQVTGTAIGGNLEEDPFLFVGRSSPRDSTDHSGNRVRVYEHSTTRHITFAPGTPQPRPRVPGAPMYRAYRRPTPFPLLLDDVAGTPGPEVHRAATPFPTLSGAEGPDFGQTPSQEAIDFQQRMDEERRNHQERLDAEARDTAELYDPFQRYHSEEAVLQRNARAPRRPRGAVPYPPQPDIGAAVDGGIRIHTGPLRTHPDGRFRHPPLGWRPIEIDERQMFIDEYGVVPWEDQTPYILAAADRRRGITNPLRPTRPTWEEEDDSDEEELPRYRRTHGPDGQSDEGEDDDASIQQNRPEDYQQRPPGRRTLRVMNPDPDDVVVMAPPEPPVKPSICRSANVDQAPLYGTMIYDRGIGQQTYDPTYRFHEWLHDASTAAEARDDFFHQWLRVKEAESAKKTRLPTTISPSFRDQTAAAKSNAATAANSSPLTRKDGKRGAADSPSDERPSKRSRLASTFRRKLSLSGTAMATTHGSGDTSNSSVAKRRLSGLEIFSHPSLSTFRAGLSRASSVGPKRVRIAVVGDSTAGKTTLLNRLYTGMYQPAVKSVHYRSNDFSMAFDGHPIILEAWDIPGGLAVDETHPLNRSFFDAALICFSVDNVLNVDNAPHWVRVLQACLVVDLPLYLVGTKSDARPCFPKLRLPFMNEATPSSPEQCEDVARKIGAVEYFECSAKTGDGVNDMFDTIIKHVRSKKDEEELKRLSRLRKEKLKRGMQNTGRRISNLFRGKGSDA